MMFFTMQKLIFFMFIFLPYHTFSSTIASIIHIYICNYIHLIFITKVYVAHNENFELKFLKFWLNNNLEI